MVTAVASRGSWEVVILGDCHGKLRVVFESFGYCLLLLLLILCVRYYAKRDLHKEPYKIGRFVLNKSDLARFRRNAQVKLQSNLLWLPLVLQDKMEQESEGF